MHYGQSVAHIDYYLDEFTFRFNRRNSHQRGLLFYGSSNKPPTPTPTPTPTSFNTQQLARLARKVSG